MYNYNRVGVGHSVHVLSANLMCTKLSHALYGIYLQTFLPQFIVIEESIN